MIAQLAVMAAGGGIGGGGSGSNTGGSRVSRAGGLTLHRSNSSLELPHSPERTGRAVDAQPLRREYGSHGSIDVVGGQCNSASGGDNLFAMLQDFRSGRTSADRLYGHHHSDNPTGMVSTDEVCGPTSSSSPKLRLKLNRLWGGKESVSGGMSSLSTPSSTPSTVVPGDLEERHRRRAFLHYDCQSLTANLGYAAKLRGILLARRRNTATGASAASTIRAPTPDEGPDCSSSAPGADTQEDSGDGKSNDLLEPCPFFRNEIGGEGEREVALGRSPMSTPGGHRPSLAYGVSVLEPLPGETLWKHTCPLRKRLLPIESIDEGARYYRKYFLAKDHQNWFGMDDQLGPVAISIRRDGNHYRIIVRTSELLTLRGSIPEEALCLRNNQTSRIPTREIMELVAPEVQLGCLKLGTQPAEEALARLDEQGLSNRYKVGVLYCRAGQRTEEEMYNNQHSGPAFLEFLETIGQRVRLKGFEGYKAGLDTRTDSTGTHTVAATHRGAQVTLHVATMLPFTPNNRQQLLRKRHIGNDIVTIVFQEPGALPFSPKRIRSQFQHVFIIVRAINPCSENTQYSVAVSRSKEVPIFGPPVPKGAIFNKGKSFADFILAKVINAENAAHRSEKFSTMATRTRQEYLKDLAVNYSTTTIIDTGQKFSIMSFSSKKKTTARPRLACDATQRGAICWQVILEESTQNTDCYLGISVDTIVLIEEHSRQTIFVSPCVNILGWHAQTNSLRLYYHQGECISIHVRPDYTERDEIMEIVARLRAVTQGSPASELSLRRNSLGQLGFHVQPDGVVTQVESMGQSWQAGLRQGSRLVEICKVAVSTLSHDQMVDLLKTSAQVTVTVIPPTNDGQPRRGCSLQSCEYLSGNYESDYENVTNSESTSSQQSAQQAQQYQKNQERSMSPPRSSNSSGYGTGSSSRSFADPRFMQENTTGGHDERWYDGLLETHDKELNNLKSDGTPPPPLPARQGPKNSKNSKHQYHEYYTKESNYVSPRVLHESNYQRIDEINRNNWGQLYGHTHHVHQKLTASVSLPLAQNSSYSVAKTINQFEAAEHNNIYDTEASTRVQMRSKKEGYGGDGKPMAERRVSSYEFVQDPETSDINQSNQQNQLNQSTHQDINESSKDSHEFIIGDKVTCLKSELPERVLTRKLAHAEYTRKDYAMSSLPPEVKIYEGNGTDIPASALPSEDEFANSCENQSPGLKRSNKQRSGAGNPSPRNQSPRPKSLVRAPHRNSANLSSSTLQEDLMKLINPDYIGNDNSQVNNNNVNVKENGTSCNDNESGITSVDKVLDNRENNKNESSNKLEIQNRCRSRENLCGTSATTLSVLSTSNRQENSAGSEVILTMARPATVISNTSTNSSPAPSENKLSKEERLSPRVTKTLFPLKVSNVSGSVRDSTEDNQSHCNEEIVYETGTSLTDLQSHLSNLELRVARETRRRLSLEEEVRKLRDENRRLQDENHAAAQQLRRFTEWFFQTIDHQ
ncbi:signal-induced proliferation-associated 1-like protein 2 [Diachasma alloeum]|uniref:signal-induced proliferation-associated 1-like protein 2 n=1 Tax=Diachasma alloeum TaxID=454923 RepID=UPI0007381861|nr:signal-induced proliferation-associated 1-like protein 2 [Diachasma alloeum]